VGKVVVRLDNHEIILTGRAARIVRWLARNAERVNENSKGSIQMHYRENQLAVKVETAYDTVE
jgi:hypothetical protein